MKRVLFAVLVLALGLAAPSQAQEMQECFVVEEPSVGESHVLAGRTAFGPDDPIVLSVVVGYDTDFAVQAAASGTTVEELIAEAFRWGNEAARISGMRTRARVIGLQEFPYTGTMAWSFIHPWWKSTGASFKAAHGAQLAFYAMSDSVMGGGAASFYTGSPTQAYAEGALRADNPSPELSPRDAFNGMVVFHEIFGHTQGARHSVPTDQPGNGCHIPSDNTCRGYAWYSEELMVRDIMANWPTLGAKFIQRFSNPYQTYQGLVTGEVGFMEAAQVIDENAASVYNFTNPAGATVCLDDGVGVCVMGRFYMTATWRDYAGNQGWAVPIEMSDAANDGAALFWFFNQNNMELFVKVKNACSYNNRFWVFAAGLTDVEVHLRVEDTWAWEFWTMDGVLGTPFGVNLDTNAFATCP